MKYPNVLVVSKAALDYLLAMFLWEFCALWPFSFESTSVQTTVCITLI